MKHKKPKVYEKIAPDGRMMLNIGCGKHFHPDWTNVDFSPSDSGIIGHNILEGIPFDDETFNVVYHSHLLEHFDRKDGFVLVKECYRVLKTGGIIRIVVPDLEELAVAYLEWLKRAANGEEGAADNYEWIVIELLDQMVRSCPGGEHAKYLAKQNPPNLDFILSRGGISRKTLRDKLLKRAQESNTSLIFRLKALTWKTRTLGRSSLSRLSALLGLKLLGVFNRDLKGVSDEVLFRQSGELHKWMYDRVSMKRLLEACGFQGIRFISAAESSIKDWHRFKLDCKDGGVFKPESFCVEAERMAKSTD